MNAPVIPVVSATVAPAECYTIRNGWAWAHIFVRHGLGKLHDGGPRGWVHVAVISDYGSFGYCWTHIGGGRWQDFLAGLDMHYAMNKMLGASFHVPLSIDEAEAQGRKTILQYRREGSLDAKDARLLWDGLNDADREGDLSGFLRDWDRCSEGRWYAHDWWDHSWDKVNPQATGFWREIWPHFIDALAERDPSAVAPELGGGKLRSEAEPQNVTAQGVTGGAE